MGMQEINRKKINTVRILLYQGKNTHVFCAYKIRSMQAI